MKDVHDQIAIDLNKAAHECSMLFGIPYEESLHNILTVRDKLKDEKFGWRDNKHWYRFWFWFGNEFHRRLHLKCYRQDEPRNCWITQLAGHNTDFKSKYKNCRFCTFTPWRKLGSNT